MTSTLPTPAPHRRRLRLWLGTPLFWLFGSLLTHGSIVAAMFIGRSAAAAAGGGEDGLRGAGDTAIDVSVVGADTTEIAPPAPVAPTPPVTPPPKVPPVEVAPPPPPEPPDPDSILPPPPPEPTPPRLVPPAGAGAAEANGGRTPGPTRLGVGPGDAPKGNTIEGQRALLPSAKTCKDPVEGVWESLKYNPHGSSWVRFTLLVHRAESGTLSGSIHSHTWYGNPLDRVPPPCSPFGFEMSVAMKATGRVDLMTHISFSASAYTVTAVQCPSAHADYAPDNFSGIIDTDRQEFQSVNNDGATDIDAPYVFRRTGCID
ncbi:MAG: hypothetical protein ABIP39_15515 [Polyangiaceae bacterium]